MELYSLPARLVYNFQLRRLGGPGSGNFGHAGRPGQVGGSGAGDGSAKDDMLRGQIDENNDGIDAAYSETSPDPILYHFDEGFVSDKDMVRLTATREKLVEEGRRLQREFPRLSQIQLDELRIVNRKSTIAGDYRNGVVTIGADAPATSIPDKITHGWFANASVEGTFRHEIGHHVNWQVMSSSAQKEWGSIWTKDLGAMVSGYAAESSSEGFAESFSVWTRFEKDGNQLPEPIKLFFEKHLPRAKKAVRALGGPGSGNFGHAGRPGERGGSSDAAVGRLAKLQEQHGELIPHSAIFSHYDENHEAQNVYESLGIDTSKAGREETLKLSTLYATQDEVDVAGLTHYLKGTGRNTERRPIVLQLAGEHYIIEGHHRVAAMILQGKTEVPVEVYEYDEKLAGLGGRGSGNFGHAGRPGQVGGSQSQSFKEWFGDSKVVNAKGEPLVVYRGMNPYHKGALITSIDNPSLTHTLDNEDLEGVKIAGFFGNQKVANTYGWQGNAIYPVVLSFQTPFVIDATGKKAFEVQFTKSGRLFRDAIRSGKYDSVIIKNTADEGDLYVALSSKQIKSAVGGFKSRVYERGSRDLASAMCTLNCGFATKEVKALGGLGSGNFGHAGRPGERGGSSSSRAPYSQKTLDAVQNYTGDSQPINDALWSGQEIPSGWKDTASELSVAIKTSPLPRDTRLYRAIPKEQLSAMVPGTIFTSKGFVSTSRSIEITKRTLEEMGDDPTDWATMRILAPVGTGGLDVNGALGAQHYFRWQEEVVLDARTRFEVISRNEGRVSVRVVS